MTVEGLIYQPCLNDLQSMDDGGLIGFFSDNGVLSFVHIGIVVKVDGGSNMAQGVYYLHLEGHYALRACLISTTFNFSNSVLVSMGMLDDYNRQIFFAMCRIIVREVCQNRVNISFGLSNCITSIFDLNQFCIVPDVDGFPMTCSSFVLSLICSLALGDLFVGEWTISETDSRWHARVCDTLQSSCDQTGEPSQEYVDNQRNYVGCCFRYRPDHVLALCQHEWQGPYDQNTLSQMCTSFRCNVEGCC